MTKSMSQAEFDELKKFLSFYSRHFTAADQLPVNLRPEACLERLEKMGRGKAVQGLRQATNDIIEQTRRLDRSQVAELDRQLRNLDLVTLSELRRRFSRQYAKIIKRGTIIDDAQYYMIRGILDDSSSRLRSDERVVLARMVEKFENEASSVAARGRR